MCELSSKRFWRLFGIFFFPPKVFKNMQHQFTCWMLLLMAAAKCADAGPVAYALCQSAAAASCTATTVAFVPCYAAAQQACAATLLVPEPSCSIM